ncbi:MAG: cytochrome c maturation protein CcmE [Acidimicrobiia bacterium]|nr:cytochrome c maturation protein CcmE [Acidimicrobiia bacterium]
MRNKLFVVPALGILAVIAGFLLWSGILDNTVYYLFPDEAIAQKADFPDGRVFRLGGIVVPGSVTDDGTLRFSITDGSETIEVRSTRTPPELFQEDISVLIEGSWDADEFVAEQIIIRHDEQYRAPDGYETGDAG